MDKNEWKLSSNCRRNRQSGRPEYCGREHTADSGINVADRIPVEEEAAGWNVTNPRFHS